MVYHDVFLALYVQRGRASWPAEFKEKKQKPQCNYSLSHLWSSFKKERKKERGSQLRGSHSIILKIARNSFAKM